MALPRTVVHAVPLIHFDTAGLTGAFQAINPSGLDASCFLARIVNDSGNAITISLNGTSDADYILAHGTWEINAQQNAQPQAEMCQFKKGQIFYVSGTAGAGTVTLAGYYV